MQGENHHTENQGERPDIAEYTLLISLMLMVVLAGCNLFGERLTSVLSRIVGGP